MKIFHVKSSAVLGLAAALIMSGAFGLACSKQSPLGPDPDDPPPAPGQDIIITEQSQLDAILAKYVVSESMGEITALATCAGEVGDEGCNTAARQQLREEAKKRGLGLVVIHDILLRPTSPAQMYFRATVHQITPR